MTRALVRRARPGCDEIIDDSNGIQPGTPA
jgi:hypothetical protein